MEPPQMKPRKRRRAWLILGLAALVPLHLVSLDGVVHAMVLSVHGLLPQGPDSTEVSAILIRYLPPILKTTVLLAAGLAASRALQLSVPRVEHRMTNLFLMGLRTGLLFSLLLFFVYWWIRAPFKLPYTGVTGYASPVGIPLITTLLVFGAICEEVYFRGFLYRLAQKELRQSVAAWVSVISFAAWHPDAYFDPYHMSAVIASAVILTDLTRRSGSPIPAAVCHSCFNLIVYNLGNRLLPHP